MSVIDIFGEIQILSGLASGGEWQPVQLLWSLLHFTSLIAIIFIRIVAQA